VLSGGSAAWPPGLASSSLGLRPSACGPPCLSVRPAADLPPEIPVDGLRRLDAASHRLDGIRTGVHIPAANTPGPRVDTCFATSPYPARQFHAAVLQTFWAGSWPDGRQRSYPRPVRLRPDQQARLAATEASGVPNSIFWQMRPVTLPSTPVHHLWGAARKTISTPRNRACPLHGPNAGISSRERR